MYLDIIILGIAPIIGLVIGMLPAIGSFMIMIAFYPLLMHVDPQISICFYAMLITSSQFSGSVSAIWFGILGEYTSMPILREREFIIRNNLQMTCLQFTAYSSVIATVVALIGMNIVVLFAIENRLLLRTEILLSVILITILFSLCWPYNRWYINMLLILTGLILGFIGYDSLTKIEFMTFNNSYLYGGLPFISVVLGLYAVPVLIKTSLNLHFNKIELTIPEKKPIKKFPLFSSLRGCVVGFFLGLIPMLGTISSSNTAYFIEKGLNNDDTINNSIKRISSSEAANNAASISVLMPLLILGLPIQPSEVILYEIITSNYWLVSSVNTFLLVQLSCMILLSVIISYILCWTFVQSVALFFYKYHVVLTCIIVLLIASNIGYVGFQEDQMLFYLSVFVVMLIFGLTLIRYVDMFPLLMAFMIQNQLLSSSATFIDNYF